MTADWTTPLVWKAKQQPLASEMNTYISNNLDFLFRALQVAHYQDQKATTVAGGSSVTGSWQTRTLTTEVSDIGGIGSLSSNQITIQAGRYLAYGLAPFYKTGLVQLRLQDVTTPATLIEGPSADSAAADAVQVWAHFLEPFLITAAKAVELQYQCATAQATNGLGRPHSFGGTEKYASLYLWFIGE